MCITCDKTMPFSSVNITNSLHEYLNRELLESEDIKMLFKGINEVNSNNIVSDDDFDLTPIIDCKYMDINSFRTFKSDKNRFSIIHLNIASLKKHKEELETILSVIGISETKIKKSVVPDFNIKGYKAFSTPTRQTRGVFCFIHF